MEMIKIEACQTCAKNGKNTHLEARDVATEKEGRIVALLLGCPVCDDRFNQISSDRDETNTIWFDSHDDLMAWHQAKQTGASK